MNNAWQGKIKKWQGEILKTWGRITNDELGQVHGDQLRLEGLIQEKYGLRQAEARKKMHEIERKYSL